MQDWFSSNLDVERTADTPTAIFWDNFKSTFQVVEGQIDFFSEATLWQKPVSLFQAIKRHFNYQWY